MGREIRPDFEQALLFPPLIEDWVSKDHPARFIRAFVQSLDLAELGIKVPSGPGGSFYSLETLLAIWLYGYFEKIRSSRALERACMNMVGFIWLTGNRPPDHNTIWRFWRTNRKSMKALFRSAVRVAVDADLVSMALHAVDGTKIKSAASMTGCKGKERLEKWLQRLDEKVEAAIKEIDANGGGSSPEYRLPEALQETEKLREKVRSALDRLEEEKRKGINPSEPDARLTKKYGKTDLGYNAQAVTEEGGLIVAAEIVDNAGDMGALVPMLDEVKDTLGAVAEETVADGGYSSGEEMAKAEEREFPVLMTPQEGRKRTGDEAEFAAKHFLYDPDLNTVVCPKGESLRREGEPKWGRRKRYKVQSFRCTNKDCPFRDKCTRDPRGRKVEISENRAAKDRMRRKLERPEKQAALKRRAPIAERTFALIKHIAGFRRWTYRGIEAVRAQWHLVCTALNLKTQFKHWVHGRVVIG